MSPVPAAALLGALAAAALLADRPAPPAAIAAILLVVCLRAPARRRWIYIIGALLASGSILVLSPFLQSAGSHPLWSGPIVPVLGSLDVTREEIVMAAVQAFRLAAVSLAFTAYALLLDHDRLVQAAGFARRSALAVALATRLLPTLERDATGMLEALRGRGIAVSGVRGHAGLLSPLLAGSLERGLNLAEAMEARGYGRPGATRLPRPRHAARDALAFGSAVLVLAVGILWL